MPQDVMDSVQRLRQLAQQTGSLKSSTEQKIITTTKKVVPVNQPANAPATQSNTVSTSSPVVAEPAPTVIAIEPANPDVVYIPNYNPNVVYGSWANTAYPPVYLPPPAGEPFVDSFVRGFGIWLQSARDAVAGVARCNGRQMGPHHRGCGKPASFRCTFFSSWSPSKIHWLQS